MSHRFFIATPAAVGGVITFDAPTAQQIHSVLRLAPGDDVIVLDDSGWEYQVRLESVGRGQAQGVALNKRLATGEPRTKIVIFQAVLKGSKFEWVLQKGTELGVVAFVPVITARTVPIDTSDSANRLVRWQRIIQEAAEQSRRARLPRLHPPVSLAQGLRQAQGLALIPWEGEPRRSLKMALSEGPSAGGTVFSVSLFIGPEGGFTDEEILAARAANVVPVSLGPRILRAETAGIVAASAILYELGDLGD